MDVAVVQHVDVSTLDFNSGIGVTKSFPQPVTPGNTVAVLLTTDAAASNTVPAAIAVVNDNQNVYTITPPQVAEPTINFALNAQFAYAENVPGGFTDVRVTLDNPAYGGFALVELANVDSVSATAGASSIGPPYVDTISAGPVTNVPDGSAILAAASTNNQLGNNNGVGELIPAAGFVQLGGGGGGSAGWGMSEYATGVGGSVSASMSSVHNQQWAFNMIVFQAAPPPSGDGPPPLGSARQPATDLTGRFIAREIGVQGSRARLYVPDTYQARET